MRTAAAASGSGVGDGVGVGFAVGRDVGTGVGRGVDLAAGVGTAVGACDGLVDAPLAPAQALTTSNAAAMNAIGRDGRASSFTQGLHGFECRSA